MTSTSDTNRPVTSREASDASREVPSWLTQPQDYQPIPDRDVFIVQSILSMSSALARLRLDDGAATPFSPSAPTKLLICLLSILLVSLSRNYLFVLVVLSAILLRATLLPSNALRRVAGASCAAAALTLIIMAPAALLGQPRTALTLSTKALVTTTIVLECTLTTPSSQLTGALRAFRIPSLFILTLDLALRSIVRLGEVALEVLTALRLRSVGHNRDKSSSLGGVGGVVLIKAAEASQATHDAMSCRGFDGEYDVAQSVKLGWTDAVWAVLLALLLALFFYLQGQV